MCLTELELPNQHAQYFLPRTSRQSLSCVLIPFPCVLPGCRVEFCQWCALVRCSLFCLTFLFVPFAPRHHRTSHHGISTHLLHFGVTGFLLSPSSFRRFCSDTMSLAWFCSGGSLALDCLYDTGGEGSMSVTRRDADDMLRVHVVRSQPPGWP